MKIKTRKGIIFAALLALILTAGLIISCISPIDKLALEDEDLLPGYGRVVLSVGNKNSNGRTILPDVDSGTGLPTDTKYLLVLKGGTQQSGLANFYKNVTPNAGPQSIAVPIGKYDSAQVFAYNSDTALDASTTDYTYADLDDYAIGESTIYDPSSGIDVTASGSVSLSSHTPVLYIPGDTIVTNAAGNGSFTYNITNGATRLNPSGATLTIKTLAGGSTSYTGTSVTIGSKQTVGDLASGYYKVVFALKDMSATPKTVYLSEYLHIYKNMESSFVRTITDTMLPAGGNTGITIGGAQGIPKDMTSTLTMTPVTGVTITTDTTNKFWKVYVENTVTNFSMDFSVTDPTGGVTFGDWFDDVANAAITAIAGNGVTISPSGQILTIGINTADTTPYFNLTNAVDYYTYIELIYNSVKYHSPNIIFEFEE